MPSRQNAIASTRIFRRCSCRVFGAAEGRKLMKGLVVVLLLLLALSVVKGDEGESNAQCNYKKALPSASRPHSVSIVEFGAVGDGKTLNTLAFENAVFYLKSFADKGGAQLYVPSGRWLTGSFNLTNHLTLFLERDAIILGSQGAHFNVHLQNITIHAPSDSPSTDGIVPDSSSNVCIEDCSISVGNDCIVLKSGWDEYGILYGQPTSNVHINRVHLQTPLGSALAFGSEMSGGISSIHVDHIDVSNSFVGIELKTAKGRGGFMKDIFLSNIEMENVHVALRLNGHYGTHPDDHYDSNANPVISGIAIRNMIGTNITLSGNLTGIHQAPFTDICLSDISLSIPSEPFASWFCSDVSGFSHSVFPTPCSALQSPYINSSSICFSLLYPNGHAAYE
ncbi:hypothetical protein ACLOJK_017744 [Asimina triloba]